MQHEKTPGWVIALSVLPALGFCWVWSRFAVNIPFWDDLFVVENSVLPIERSDSLVEKLRYWFGWYTQTEHRIVYNRLVFWVIRALDGTINYRTAMVVGNLSLVGMGLLFLKLFRQLGFLAKFWLPVPFLLFGLASYYNQFWGMGSVSNFTVVWFALLAIYFLVKPTRTAFVLAVGFALAATLTLASGLLVWAVGLVLLFFQRRYAALTAWALLTALTVALYVQGYVRPDWAPDPLRNAFNLSSALRNFTGFLGATIDLLQPRQATFVGYELFGIEYRPSLLPVVAGAGLLVFGTYALLTRVLWPFVRQFSGKQKEATLPTPLLVLSGVLGFVLITALAAALSRAGGDLSAVVNSKYKIYSVLAVIACYALGLLMGHGGQREWLFRIGLVFAVCWHGLGYAQYLPNVLNTRQALRADAANFRLNGSWRFYPAGIVTELANRHTTTIQRADFYRLTEEFSFRKKNPSALRFSVETRPDYLLLTEETLPPPTDLRQGRLVVLSADSANFVFPASPRLAPWRQALRGRLYTTGTVSRVIRANLPPGRYRIGVFDESNGVLRQTNQFLTL
jgi:hypothetical protein